MEEVPICQGCFNADLKAIPLFVDGKKQKLWHCDNCDKSYWLHHGEPEELEGLALHCATREQDPENCDPTVRKFFSFPHTRGSGDSLHPPEKTYFQRIREADAVCIRCPHKNFVIGST